MTQVSPKDLEKDTLDEVSNNQGTDSPNPSKVVSEVEGCNACQNPSKVVSAMIMELIMMIIL